MVPAFLTLPNYLSLALIPYTEVAVTEESVTRNNVTELVRIERNITVWRLQVSQWPYFQFNLTLIP